MVGVTLHRGMSTSFTLFLLRRVPLNEVSEYFPKQYFNEAFREACEKILMSEQLAPAVREDLLRVKGLDLVGYADSSLRRSSVQDFELDATVSEILVRLLITPGSLFKKWDRKSPISARLKVAIRNSIITMAKKRQKRAKRSEELTADLASPLCRDDSETINAFRDALRSQYGDDHVRVLDARLAGDEVKTLVSSLGSAWRIKAIVRDIKSFVVGWGDECLQRAVAQMQVKEEETLAKRFGRTPAGAAR
jgi:hypothetical protein